MQKPTLNSNRIMEVFFGSVQISSLDNSERMNTETNGISEPEEFDIEAISIEQINELVDLAFSIGYFQGKAKACKLAQEKLNKILDKEKVNSALFEEFNKLCSSITDFQKQIQTLMN